MAVDSIGSTSTSSSALSNIGLNQDDFIKVLLTQLTFQDPLKPLDNQEFIAQMAQLTNLQVSQQQNDKLDTLLTIQSVSQAVGLIGKTVEVQTAAGGTNPVGQVTTISFSNGNPSLTVNTSSGELTQVSLSQIVLVR